MQKERNFNESWLTLRTRVLLTFFQTENMICRYLPKFSNRKDVKFVVIDMTGRYRKLIHELFPQTKIIVDRYHYVRKIIYAPKRIQVEEQKKYSGQWLRLLKWSKYILLKDTRKLTIEDRFQLENMFCISKNLYKEYQLKQQFEYVRQSSCCEEAVKRLN